MTSRLEQRPLTFVDRSKVYANCRWCRLQGDNRAETQAARYPCEPPTADSVAVEMAGMAGAAAHLPSVTAVSVDVLFLVVMVCLLVEVSQERHTASGTSLPSTQPWAGKAGIPAFNPRTRHSFSLLCEPSLTMPCSCTSC